MQKRVLMYLALGVCFLLFVFYVTGQIQGRLDANEKQAIQADKAFVQLVKGHRKQIDAALIEVAKWHKVASQHLVSANTAGHQADVAAADTSADHWHVAYLARTQEVMELRASLGFKTAEADTLAHLLNGATADIDSLNVRLANANKREQCHIAGFIPCPSRTTMLIGGVALGAVAMAAATH